MAQNDYQLYGEPPPSYHLSKYFPEKKVDLNEDNHIYENIDESTTDNTKQALAKQRKGRFKSIKNKERNKSDKNKFQSDNLNLSSSDPIVDSVSNSKTNSYSSNSMPSSEYLQLQVEQNGNINKKYKSEQLL